MTRKRTGERVLGPVPDGGRDRADCVLCIAQPLGRDIHPPARRTELVPRRACWLGLIGGPLLIITGTAILFTGNDPSEGLRSLQGLATIPEFFWELFLGIYCTFKGFRPSAPILQPGFRQGGSLGAPEVGPT